MKRTPLKRSPMKRKGRGFAASEAQRAKVRDAVSIVSGAGPCDPAHLWPRSRGGCDDPLCVVPLTRVEHRAFDEGELDLLPALVAHDCIPEMQHALDHAHGDLLGLLWRLSPSEREAV